MSKPKPQYQLEAERRARIARRLAVQSCYEMLTVTGPAHRETLNGLGTSNDSINWAIEEQRIACQDGVYFIPGKHTVGAGAAVAALPALPLLMSLPAAPSANTTRKRGRRKAAA